MISDMLARVAMIDRAEDGGVDIDAAIDTVVETTDRHVSSEERDKLRDVLEGGWLDE